MVFGMGSSFNEPKDDDTTSAPPETVPATSSVQGVISQILGKKKKNPRAPTALAQAIGRSKRAYQSKRRFG